MRKILVFALLFPPIFALSTVIYLQTHLSYQDAVLAVANWNLRTWHVDVLLSKEKTKKAHDEILRDIELRVVPEGHEGGWHVKAVVKKDGSLRDFYRMDGSGLHLIYLNIALFPALLLATPGLGLKRRAILLALGLVLIFIVHVVAAVMLVRTKAWLTGNPGDSAAEMMRNIFRRTGQLFAVLQWAAFTWHVWLPSDSELSGGRAPQAVAATPPSASDALMPAAAPATKGVAPAPKGAATPAKAISRGAPCPCGSGRKYKNCCGAGQKKR